MAYIVLSNSKIKFWIGPMLPFLLFMFQTKEIILPDWDKQIHPITDTKSKNTQWHTNFTF